MDYEHDLQTANDIACEALEKLHALSLPPTPYNFEIWYVYFAGMNPDVKVDLDAIVASKQKITQQHCLDIYEKYLSAGRQEEIFKRAGDEISSTLADVSGMVNNVKTVTARYNRSLETASEKLTKTSSPKEVQGIVKTMVTDTKAVMEHNKQLESHLLETSKQMDELKRDMEQIRKEAMTDGLTGLANRKSFDMHIRNLWEESKKENRGFCLLLLDIDYFKAFNDNYGHQVGDQVLKLVGKTLTDGIKGRDMAARYGGEEFAILLPETPLNAGLSVAESLRQAVVGKEVINRTSGEKLGRITISAGVAQFDGSETVESLIRRADVALYAAKHNGRNQVSISPMPKAAKAAS